MRHYEIPSAVGAKLAANCSADEANNANTARSTTPPRRRRGFRMSRRARLGAEAASLRAKLVPTLDIPNCEIYVVPLATSARHERRAAAQSGRPGRRHARYAGDGHGVTATLISVQRRSSSV